MITTISKYLLPAGGAILGYLAGDKDTAVRNAMIGAGVGFGAKWLTKPSLLPANGQEDLPPPPASQEPADVSSVPQPNQEVLPYDRPDYIADTGEQEDWAGNDQFPEGAVAILQTPFAADRNVMVTEIVKMGNGNWVTQPGQHVYWTSVGNMARDPRVHVQEILDQNGTVAYWQQNPQNPTELQSYP